MANEISMSATLSVAAGSSNISATTTKQITQTAAGAAVQRRQTIPTSDTVITLTGVSTPRVIHITNMDATNYIVIGPTSGGAIIACARLRAGETLVMPLEPSVVLRGQANTASVIIEVLIADT